MDFETFLDFVQADGYDVGHRLAEREVPPSDITEWDAHMLAEALFVAYLDSAEWDGYLENTRRFVSSTEWKDKMSHIETVFEMGFLTGAVDVWIGEKTRSTLPEDPDIGGWLESLDV